MARWGGVGWGGGGGTGGGGVHCRAMWRVLFCLSHSSIDIRVLYLRIL